MAELNPSYLATMLAAVTLGALMLRRTQRTLPLSGREKLGIGLGAFCGAMIGAKLPFVLADWKGLFSGGVWFSHGKTIMSGIVGGYFGVEFAKWILRIRVRTGDSFAVPVAAAVAVGRFACFVGGCCFGTCTALPWGVVFPTAIDDPHCPRHPTQLYEAAFHASAALILFQLWRKQWLPGQLIKAYLIAYLAYRFLSEFIRPEPRWFAGLTGYQWAALALIPLFIALWWRDAKRKEVSSVGVASR